MWIRKANVKISVAYYDELPADFIQHVETEFSFFYTPITRIETLLRFAHRKCRLSNPYREERTHFMVWKDEERYWLDEQGKVVKLYKHLNCDGCIELEYVLYNGIGAVVDRIDGIKIYYHTRELRHVPHIHADHQGDKISIEILTLRVKGKFKNMKKQKEAVQYVRDNQEKLLEEYNNKTNGIKVFCYEI